jgi:hypothetical protein
MVLTSGVKFQREARPNEAPLQTGMIWQCLFATEAEHWEEVMNDALRKNPIVTSHVPVLF